MKSLKSILVLLFTASLLFGFVSCSDDDNNENAGWEESERTVTLDFDISSFSDGLYYAVDPELENVKWYLRLKDSSWAFGAKIPTGYYGTETLYDFVSFYKGTFTTEEAKISFTKTHHEKVNANTTLFATDEEIVDGYVSNTAMWAAYPSEIANWKSETLSDSKLSLPFTTSELDSSRSSHIPRRLRRNKGVCAVCESCERTIPRTLASRFVHYQTATQQQIISFPQLTRN